MKAIQEKYLKEIYYNAMLDETYYIVGYVAGHGIGIPFFIAETSSGTATWCYFDFLRGLDMGHVVSLGRL